MAWDHERSTQERGYGAPWRRLRDLVLNREPICRACRRRPATTVDHIIPKADGGTDDESNLQPLCNPCHDAKTIAERTLGSRVHILCGPPGSGRLAYFGEHARPGDCLLHLEQLTTSTRLPERVLEELCRATRRELVENESLVVWLIVPGATDEARSRIASAWGSQPLLFDPGREACLRRIAADPARRGLLPRLTLDVDDWYRRAGDPTR